ncbi:type I-E CRISPR-associated protein Cas5/CasD [Streptomyces griseoviridis]|uniref:type I-E CRISPR-associated protein Cas5/CasD n=1 Tax=Streptomyces griseoviridis TaxID=45398 RepID=UPI0033C37F49
MSTSPTSVLALLLAGPLQAWGAASRFSRRTTESAPTKSGVIGLLAAAAGIARDDDAALAALAALRFGVRIDQPGTRIRDFHKAMHPVTGKTMPLTERFYLADAVFVAAVEGDHALLERLDAALRSPVYPPFLGRRSCPPATRVDLGLHRDAVLEDVLRTVAWQASPWYRRRHHHPETGQLTVLREKQPGEDTPADTLCDQPLSYSPAHRRHALRSVVTDRVRPPRESAHHDPFDAFSEDDDL